MKGLVLSGGKGTRLRPFTYTGAKQLVPLANKPVLFYVLEDLVAAGISDVGIVVGDTADQIREAVGTGDRFGCTVTYIQQDRPGGLAHAVKTAREFLGDDRFVVYLGDNFIQGGMKQFADEFRRSEAASHLLLYHMPNPRSFGVAEIRDGLIVGLQEKPHEPKTDLALVGIYFFDHRFHAAIDATVPSRRGELEMTDAINKLLEMGNEVRPHILDGWWIDTGKMEDMLDANRLVLQDLGRRIDGEVDQASKVQGSVVVEAGATVVDSVLRGPLIIGPGSRIERSYIGPFSSIGPNCLVQNSEVAHTIVLEGSQIVDLPHRIEDSLIGRDVTITRSTGLPKAYNLMLGDHSKIELL